MKKMKNYDTSDTEYDKCGAGVIDARAAFYTSDSNRYVTSSFAANSAYGSTKSYTVNVSSSDTKIRISLSWLKYIVCSGEHYSASPSDHTLADLDLYVYSPNGTLVKSSTKVGWNTEIVDFDPQPYGTGAYTMVVKQQSSSDRTVYFGLAWW